MHATVLTTYQRTKTGRQNINANENIVAEAMENIDADYAALVSEAALASA